MIHLMYQLVLLGVTVMLLNAGGSGADCPTTSHTSCIIASLTHMTLSDCTELKCETTQHPLQQCSFYTGTDSPLITNSSQRDTCVLTVSGKELWGEAQDLGYIRKVVTVYCRYLYNGTNSIVTPGATVTVWRTDVPISCFIIGLAVASFLTILVLISVCLLCISVTKYGCGTASARSYKFGERISEEQILVADPAADQGDQRIKEAEDELHYATVTFTGNAPNTVKFEPCTEYATVVINAEPSPSTTA